MLPHFFETGQRVNAKQYIHVEVLYTMMKPWIKTVAGECPYVFNQDRAPPTQPKSPRTGLRPT
jgi:hypothetical protein